MTQKISGGILRSMHERKIKGEDGKDYTILEALVENAIYNFRNYFSLIDREGKEHPYTLEMGCYQAILETGIDNALLLPILCRQSTSQPAEMTTLTENPVSPQMILTTLNIDIIYQEAVNKYPELRQEINHRSFENLNPNVTYHD